MWERDVYEDVYEDVSTDELESELARLEELKTQLTALQVGLVGEVDRRQVALGDGCRTVAEWVSSRLDVPRDDAVGLVALSRTLTDLPETRHRFEVGEVGAARAALVGRVATEATEGEWLERLSSFDLAGAERRVARHRRITVSEETRSHRESMLWMQPSLDRSWWRISGGVTAQAGEVIDRALTARLDEFPPDGTSRPHRRALALETICHDSVSDPSDTATSGRGGPSVTAFVDLDVASGTGGEAGVELAAGPRIGPTVLTELVCEGSVRVVGLKNQIPVAATQATTTIPPTVRDFVLWRDGGCRADGCGSVYRLQPHHVSPRAVGGSHHPDNLVTLCWYHHHVVVHRRRHTITTTPHGRIRLHAPTTRHPP